MKPHKHAELIKAWADGAVIERYWTDLRTGHQYWLIDNAPMWEEWEEYRIAQLEPEPKPDVEKYAIVDGYSGMFCKQNYERANLKLTFDGETGELKSAEVLK